MKNLSSADADLEVIAPANLEIIVQNPTLDRINLSVHYYKRSYFFADQFDFLFVIYSSCLH